MTHWRRSVSPARPGWMVFLVFVCLMSNPIGARGQEDCNARLKEATLEFGRGRADTAIALVQRCLERLEPPQKASAYALLAKAYTYKSNEEKAKENIRELILIDSLYAPGPDDDPLYKQWYEDVRREDCDVRLREARKEFGVRNSQACINWLEKCLEELREDRKKEALILTGRSHARLGEQAMAEIAAGKVLAEDRQYRPNSEDEEMWKEAVGKHLSCFDWPFCWWVWAGGGVVVATAICWATDCWGVEKDEPLPLPPPPPALTR